MRVDFFVYVKERLFFVLFGLNYHYTIIVWFHHVLLFRKRIHAFGYCLFALVSLVLVLNFQLVQVVRNLVTYGIQSLYVIVTHLTAL